MGNNIKKLYRPKRKAHSPYKKTIENRQVSDVRRYNDLKEIGYYAEDGFCATHKLKEVLAKLSNTKISSYVIKSYMSSVIMTIRAMTNDDRWPLTVPMFPWSMNCRLGDKRQQKLLQDIKLGKYNGRICFLSGYVKNYGYADIIGCGYTIPQGFNPETDPVPGCFKESIYKKIMDADRKIESGDYSKGNTILFVVALPIGLGGRAMTRLLDAIESENHSVNNI